MNKQTIRCAIYTRKSSDEGLEQEFNSLHAQREAAEAYVRSQKHEGWEVIKTAYDDGGYSGGTMERPGLQKLLQDIHDNQVDVVVVYKIDRLTRSLFDFAKMVEIFDAHKVSFVSITQSFNTTTSMGRLTLNVLLSFAQFEREVTGERIRDKIAASKKKGMWMGGSVPLGYDVKDKKLYINGVEAGTIRTIFELYTQLGSVKKLKLECDRLGLKSKIRGTGKGGISFCIGHLYHMLTNPIYAGFVRHKKQIHAGDHAPIISKEAWDAVQKQLADGAYARKTGKNSKEPSLLVGMMFDGAGTQMTPSHAVKNGKRYRYYLSNNLNCGQGEGIRVPAHEIEDLVIAQMAAFLQNNARIIKMLGISGSAPSDITSALDKAMALAQWLHQGTTADRRPLLLELINRVVITTTGVKVAITPTGLRRLLDLPIHGEENPYLLEIEAQLRRLGGERKLIIASEPSQTTDPYLVKAIVRAHRWFGMLKRHEVSSFTELAARENIQRTYINSILPLALLPPKLTEAILDGKQPQNLRLDELIKQAQMHIKWSGYNAICNT
jgi:site-specific DNA recombinase